jgi:hypothetical protein
VKETKEHRPPARIEKESSQDGHARFIGLVLLTFIALTLSAHAAGTQKPNIVFILMDNLVTNPK